MSNQPIVLNIQYTPYSLPKSATGVERAAHAEARAFYNMTGDKNFYDYITTEGKRTGNADKKFTALEYLQKSTGVFNDTGMLDEKQVAEMKARLKKNEGNIWHGFISLNAEESYKIDTPEKCIELVKRTFPSFLSDAKFHRENVDLMCALHMDRPHHLHIHFVMWEKEPKYKGKDGTLRYRRRGKLDKKAIDGFFVRLGLFLSEKKDKLYKSRDEAMKELRKLTNVSAAMNSCEAIKKEILALAEDLPKTGRLSYGSENMAPHRERVDKIVRMLLSYDGRARKADRKFYVALEQRKREIENICGKKVFAFSNQGKDAEAVEQDLPKYHNQIDIKNIGLIEQIEADYRRRQGNLVLELARYLKPEIYEGRKITTANDKRLKRMLGVSRRIVDSSLKKFLSTFGKSCEEYEREGSNRLREIEEEIERERKKKKQHDGGSDKD